MDYKKAYDILEKYDQLHLLKHYESLTAEMQKNLLAQIDEIDFSVLDALKEEKNEYKDIQPVAALQMDKIEENKQLTHPPGQYRHPRGPAGQPAAL